jgi:hypothetical protein
MKRVIYENSTLNTLSFLLSQHIIFFQANKNINSKSKLTFGYDLNQGFTIYQGLSTTRNNH